MDFLKWMLGGLIGAAIGGAVWIAVGYFLQAEVAYVAIGIGFLGGLGVRVMAGQDEGVMCGIAGVLSAVLIIAGSKYMVVSLAIDNMVEEQLGATLNMDLTEENLIHATVTDKVESQQMAGEEIEWPPGSSYETASELADYPTDIVQAAQDEVAAMSPEQKAQEIAELQQQMDEILDVMTEQVKQQAFRESFNGFDLLWFGLAAFTAFRLGSGATEA